MVKNIIKSKLFSNRCKAQGFKKGIIVAGGKAVIGKEKKGIRVAFKLKSERMKRLRRRMLTQQRALDKYKKLIKRSLSISPSYNFM